MTDYRDLRRNSWTRTTTSFISRARRTNHYQSGDQSEGVDAADTDLVDNVTKANKLQHSDLVDPVLNEITEDLENVVCSAVKVLSAKVDTNKSLHRLYEAA